MARTKSISKKLLLIATLLVVFLVASGLFVITFLRKPDAFAKLPAFPIDSYMDGKDLWSHEDFKLEGRVENVLLRSRSGMKLLISLQPTGADLRLPVMLETASGKLPVQREQKLVLKVKLNGNSQIQCTEYEPR